MAVKQGAWTLAMLHALPDDGNKYELVRGELFVTPAPSGGHETILARLSAILTPYVVQHRLGYVYSPRAVIRFEGSEAEPDRMVRAPAPPGTAWENMPLPVLVIEVLSPATRRRDREQKRAFYLDAGVQEYWIVDGSARTITVVRRDHPDILARDVVRWQPAGATEPLEVPLAEVFGSV